MLHSIWSVLAASILLPPAGLVLLWLRSGVRVKDKVFGSIVIGMWSVVYLMLFFGLRFPLDGSGMRPIPTFGTPDAHYAELEQSRLQVNAAPAAVEAAPKPAEDKPYWTDYRGPHRDGRYDQTAVN